MTEHEKLEQIKEQSQTIGEFLEWLSEKRITLCTSGQHLTHGDLTMFTNQAVIDKYHSYFWTCLESNGEPMCFSDWYAQVFVPFISGLHTQLMAKN